MVVLLGKLSGGKKMKPRIKQVSTIPTMWICSDGKIEGYGCSPKTAYWWYTHFK